MDLLKGLFANPTMIRIATDKLRSLFTDDGVNTLVLRLNPHNLEPPLPGFDVFMFKKETTVLDKEQHDKLQSVLQANPYAISDLENRQFEALKRFFLNVLGDDPDAKNAIDDAAACGNVTSEDAAILKTLVPDGGFSKPEKPAANADAAEL